jgi:phosphoglycolate phosphatase
VMARRSPRRCDERSHEPWPTRPRERERAGGGELSAASQESSTRRRPLRAVVTDVDGTLTDAHRRLDPEAMRWVLRLESHGIPVILATGNVLPIALGLHRSLGLSGPIVAENGGVLYRKENGVETVERLVDRRVALAAYRTLRAAGLPVRRLFTDRWRESEVALEPTVSVARLRRALGGRPVRVESTGFAIHLMERRGGKLAGLKEALPPLGLTLGDCVVLGDGDNDVGMLQEAGFGVSFVSGSARARRAARYVTRRAYADGFVEGLKASAVLVRTSSLPGGN